MQIISKVFLVLSLSAIVKGQWAAAARELYQPIILSLGAAYTFLTSIKGVEDEFDIISASEWINEKLQYGKKLEWKGKSIVKPEELSEFYDDLTKGNNHTNTKDWTFEALLKEKEEKNDKIGGT